MDICDILSADAIKVPLEASNKQEAIDELVDVLASTGKISDAEELKRVVWDRETQRSTGIGEGLAIPHGKCSNLDNLVVAVGRPSEPLDFDSIDNQPVQLIVLLVSPENRIADHIQALGKISRMMTSGSFRNSAYSAKTSEEMYELFKRETAAESN